jgi:hypothetical protein
MGKKINQERISRLNGEFEASLNAFETSGKFSGPSVYFHRKTLARRACFRSLNDVLQDDLFFDYLYATLASWGMHRMGSGGAKLCEMERFRGSIEKQIVKILPLQGLKIDEIGVDQLPQVSNQVWEIIQNLEVGTQGVKIVVGSKVLHHILPDLVPPIDGEYTLNFFYSNKQINRPEKDIFLELFPQFHHLALAQSSIIAKMIKQGGCMNTSTTKVIDNAIVGYMLKNVKNKPSNKLTVHLPAIPMTTRSLELIDNMTHAGKILQAARALYKQGQSTFTRDDIKRFLSLSSADWHNGYTAIFQGMRVDHPGGAPKVGARYQKVFRRVSRGLYTLTEKGKGVM